MISITHENIVKLYDIKQTENNYYLVMEYCSGGDLDRLRGKQLDEEKVQRIVYQISAALKVLCSKHIMHRDLKLSNLLFSSDKSDALVKLADFGFARELKRNELADTYCGTPLYMAPEILMKKKYTLKADLWSIGVITYLFLTGRFPFEATSPQKLILTFNHGVVKFPPEVSISECCYDFLKKLLQIAPKQRMEWEEYFGHHFVKCPPEEYTKSLSLLPKYDNTKIIPASSLHYLPIIELLQSIGREVIEEEKKSKDIKHVDSALRVLEDILLKSNLILETFNAKERFSEITTYQKETFDLLWRIGKIIKPIISFFIPSNNLFMLDSSILLEHKKAFLVVNLSKKSISFELSKELIDCVKRIHKFEEIAKRLVENYEIIASNLVGYADAIEYMKSYNSKVSLFKYALSLAQEGEVLEHTKTDLTKVNNKYLQALLILTLLTKAHYEQVKKKSQYLECDLISYDLLDEHGNIIGGNKQLEEDINSTLKSNELNKKELVYIEKLKSELALRSKRTRDSLLN